MNSIPENINLEPDETVLLEVEPSDVGLWMAG